MELVSDAAVELVSDAAVVASSAIRDAAADEPEDVCDVMRKTADMTQRSGESQGRHLADRAIELAIRQFYTRRVVARGIDNRSITRPTVEFVRWGTSPGVTVAPCVEVYRTEYPGATVPGWVPRIEADHQYAEVKFEFTDAGDGPLAYTAFVDVATKQVVAMFYYSNFQP